MCEEKLARKVVATRRGIDGTVYEYQWATEAPYFCSVRCAANWALIHVHEELGWCDRHGWWVGTHEPCPLCPGEEPEP